MTGKYKYKGIFADTGRDDQDGLRRLVDKLFQAEQEENPEAAAAEQELRALARRLFHPNDDDDDQEGGDPA